MKKLIALLMISGLAIGSFAQGSRIRGNVNMPRVSSGGAKTTTVVVVPRAGYYNPFYSPFGYGYNPYGMGFGYGYGWGNRAAVAPTKLDLEVEQIKSDYHHEIADVRHDKSIPKAERKQRIRDIKHERDNAIIAAKQAYYQDLRERH